MSENLTETILDLDKLRDVSAITQGAIIHVEARNRFPKLIGDVLKRGEELAETRRRKSDYKFFYSRAHEVIMLSGRRGAGKTTLLLHLLEEIGKYSSGWDRDGELELTQDSANCKVIYSKLYPLDVFDPTLLGSREHLMVAIIDKIRFAVEESRQKRRASGDLSYDDGCKRSFDNWEELLRNMAEGLKVLGEGENFRGTAPAWEDPQFILDESLNRARHGEELERRFQRFLDYSLKILDKKAFIIGLDDIDTQPSIGVHVLEVLRKYLTSPQLITILSGDIELYSSIIRKMQLEAFGLSFSSQPDILARHERMISGLVDQYMNKLLPSRNRIHIGYFNKCNIANMYVLLRGNKIINGINARIELKYKVKKFVDELIENVLCIKNNEDIDAVRNILFDNPARTVVQLLIVAADNVDIERSDEKSIAFKKDMNFSPHLADIFYESLHRFGYTYADFENLASLKGMGKFVDCLVRKELFGDAPSMQLRNAETWINEAMLVVQASVTRAFASQPALALVYALDACLPQEILEREDYKSYLNTVRLKENAQSIWALMGPAANVMSYLYAHESKLPASEYALGTTKAVCGQTDLVENINILHLQKNFTHLSPLAALTLEAVQRQGKKEHYISTYGILALIVYVMDMDVDPYSCNSKMRIKLFQIVNSKLHSLRYSNEAIRELRKDSENIGIFNEIINKICLWKRFLNIIFANEEYKFCSSLFVSRFVELFVKKMLSFDKEISQKEAAQLQKAQEEAAQLQKAQKEAAQLKKAQKGAAQLKKAQKEAAQLKKAQEEEKKMTPGNYISDTIAIFLNSVYYEEYNIMSNGTISFDGEPFLTGLYNENRNAESMNKIEIKISNNAHILKFFISILTFPLLQIYTSRPLYKEIQKCVLKLMPNIKKEYGVEEYFEKEIVKFFSFISETDTQNEDITTVYDLFNIPTETLINKRQKA